MNVLGIVLQKDISEDTFGASGRISSGWSVQEATPLTIVNAYWQTKDPLSGQYHKQGVTSVFVHFHLRATEVLLAASGWSV